MIACCGLNCRECPAYLATQKDDDAAREKVAGKWSKVFNMALSAGDINCDGCLSGSERLFGHCKNCQIRACCRDRQFKTCADCSDYPCDNLSAFFNFMPNARKGLEAIRGQ